MPWWAILLIVLGSLFALAIILFIFSAFQIIKMSELIELECEEEKLGIKHDKK